MYWKVSCHIQPYSMYWKVSCPIQPYSTVRMISTAHFSVHTLLLHHYEINLAHISYFDSLVIQLSKSERWAKNNNKIRTSSTCTKFAQFLVVLVRKCIV